MNITIFIGLAVELFLKKINREIKKAINLRINL
jgi:hypothetical protein